MAYSHGVADARCLLRAAVVRDPSLFGQRWGHRDRRHRGSRQVGLRSCSGIVGGLYGDEKGCLEGGQQYGKMSVVVG